MRDDSTDLGRRLQPASSNHKSASSAHWRRFANGFRLSHPGGLAAAQSQQPGAGREPAVRAAESLVQASPHRTVIVNGQGVAGDALAGVVPQVWIDFNTGGHKLIERPRGLDRGGKTNDTPQASQALLRLAGGKPPSCSPD